MSIFYYYFGALNMLKVYSLHCDGCRAPQSMMFNLRPQSFTAPSEATLGFTLEKRSSF